MWISAKLSMWSVFHLLTDENSLGYENTDQHKWHEVFLNMYIENTILRFDIMKQFKLCQKYFQNVGARVITYLKSAYNFMCASGKVMEQHKHWQLGNKFHAFQVMVKLNVYQFCIKSGAGPPWAKLTAMISAKLLKILEDKYNTGIYRIICLIYIKQIKANSYVKNNVWWNLK